MAVADRISTTYKNRGKSYGDVAAVIRAATSRIGNYMVYFPSYEYMNAVHALYMALEPDADVLLQRQGMGEAEQAGFLGAFVESPVRTLVGFAVMGGAFAEGVDLVGTRLSGALVVGVGIPQICLERDIIRGHFDESHGMGYEYAYMYPGFNRVLQAAGRVIRSETDRGFIVLIDERFSWEDYRRLFPPEWGHARRAASAGECAGLVQEFWGEG